MCVQVYTLVISVLAIAQGPYAEIGMCPCLEGCMLKLGEVIHLESRTPCGRDSSPIGLGGLGQLSESTGLIELQQLASPGYWRGSISLRRVEEPEVRYLKCPNLVWKAVFHLPP